MAGLRSVESKYVKEGVLDIRLRILFLIAGLIILYGLRPWIAQSNYNRAMAFLSKGDFSKAERQLKKAIFIFPKFVIAYNTLGMLYQEMGKEKEALYIYRKSFQICPHNSQGYLDLAIYYFIKKNNYEEAIKWFKKAIEADRKNWMAYRYLGICLERSGLKKDALRTYRYMKEIFPQDKRIDKFIEKLNTE